MSGLGNVNVDFRPTIPVNAPNTGKTTQALQPGAEAAPGNAPQPERAEAKSVVRAEAVEELRAAFAELVSGEGLTRFVGGHGIQSRVFEFEWSEPALDISLRIPYARILSDEAAQKEDDEEVGAAIRMAILLLTVAGSMEPGSRMDVSCNDRGTAYAVYAADGELEDSGSDWAPLVRRIEAALGDAHEPLSIIWP